MVEVDVDIDRCRLAAIVVMAMCCAHGSGSYKFAYCMPSSCVPLACFRMHKRRGWCCILCKEVVGHCICCTYCTVQLESIRICMFIQILVRTLMQ